MHDVCTFEYSSTLVHAHIIQHSANTVSPRCSQFVHIYIYFLAQRGTCEPDRCLAYQLYVCVYKNELRSNVSRENIFVNKKKQHLQCNEPYLFRYCCCGRLKLPLSVSDRG